MAFWSLSKSEFDVFNEERQGGGEEADCSNPTSGHRVKVKQLAASSPSSLSSPNAPGEVELCGRLSEDKILPVTQDPRSNTAELEFTVNESGEDREGFRIQFCVPIV